MQFPEKKFTASRVRDILPGENLPEFFSHLNSAFWASFTECIPVGYQNDRGFHFGTEPTPEHLEDCFAEIA